MVEIGQEIPEQFYAAVAEILAYVYELTGRSRRRPATSGARAATMAGVN
jgi:flagellar biosynthesis protein FlhB